MTAPTGIGLVDKPGGITSHDAVAAVRRALETRRVGHAGTLDPMATGLLVMGVGRATRLLRFLGDLPKTYEGTMRLGEETTTMDADGEVVRRSPVAATDDAVASAIASLVGDSLQRPPAYSAVKVGGRKLYEAARAGDHLEAPPRPIHVMAFEALGRDGDDVAFRTTCGSGTFVRVLAADVGAALGCGAHLTRLRRTRIGSFTVEEARPPEDPEPLVPVERALAHLPRVEVDAEEATAVSHGRILGPAGVEGPYAVVASDGRIVAIYRDDGAKAKPEVVLAPAGG